MGLSCMVQLSIQVSTCDAQPQKYQKRAIAVKTTTAQLVHCRATVSRYGGTRESGKPNEKEMAMRRANMNTMATDGDNEL